MENAKRTYEMLNSELHDELPALYDSRVLFLVTNMQTLFAAVSISYDFTSSFSQVIFRLWSTQIYGWSLVFEKKKAFCKC